jgi:hypothetical protein
MNRTMDTSGHHLSSLSCANSSFFLCLDFYRKAKEAVEEVVDEYEAAEEAIFHAVEDAEKNILHAAERAEKAIEHAIEEEVDTFFHGHDEPEEE